MKRAACLIRPQLTYRRAAFIAGLRAVGYSLVDNLVKPTADDIIVLWNRYGMNDHLAQQVEDVGGRAIICENGYLGKDWGGDTWLSMGLSHHAGAGKWNVGSQKRWDDLGIKLLPWVAESQGRSDTLIFAQRGIGEGGIASPYQWAENTRNQIGGGRIRQHPGELTPHVSLEDDLKNVKQCVTWNSGAALKALILGIPVFYGQPYWIGASACKPISEFGSAPKRDDAARLDMFRRLSWAMWRLNEIESGEAFTRLLGEQK